MMATILDQRPLQRNKIQYICLTNMYSVHTLKPLPNRFATSWTKLRVLCCEVVLTSVIEGAVHWMQIVATIIALFPRHLL